VFVVNLDARKQCSALKMAKALIRISGKKISLALTIKPKPLVAFGFSV
jgi:hypothetical protein